jgi:RES domain-containing protein
MILTRLGPEAPFYRALTPRWAYLPESGAGAAVRLEPAYAALWSL